MKAIKYVLAGMLTMGLSATTMAQEVDYSVALKPIQQAFEVAPNNPNAAKDLIKQYTKEFKKDESALVALGNAYLSHGDLEQAEALANMITANKKMNGSDAYILLGDVALYRDSIGNAGPAAAQYQTAISVNPKNKKAYERYATVYRHINYDLAIKKLEEYKNIDPTYQVEAKAADLCYGEGQYQKAIEWYQKGDSNNYSESDFAKWAVSAYQIFKNDECLEIAKKGLNKFPGNKDLTRFALWGAVDGSHPEEGLKYANELFTKDGEKTSRDYAYLGYAQMAAKDYNNALTSLEKAFDMNSEDCKPLSKISEVYKNLGNEDKALEYMQKYLNSAKSPSLTDYSNLAQIYTAKGDKATGAQAKDFYNKAIDVYEGMATKIPSTTAIACYYASNIAVKNLKDNNKALTYYKRIVDFYEGKTVQGTSQQILLMALENLMYNENNNRNIEAAKGYASKILAIDPNNENAKIVANFNENGNNANGSNE